MVTEEKQARRQLEQYVLQLSKTIATYVPDNQHLKNNSRHSYDILQLKNDTFDLKQSLSMLEGKYSQLSIAYKKIVRENSHLQSLYDTCSNKTNELENRLKVWEKSTTALRISNVTEFQTKMKVAESKISSLISSNNARSQDFLALLNQIKTRNVKVDSEISLLNVTTERKLTDLGKKQMDTNSDLQLYMNQTGKNSSFTTQNKIETNDKNETIHFCQPKPLDL